MIVGMFNAAQEEQEIKHILETKMVKKLKVTYEFEIADSEDGWSCNGCWFFENRISCPEVDICHIDKVCKMVKRHEEVIEG